MHWDILSGKDMQVGSWPYLWLLLLRGCWSAISGYLPWLLLLRKAQSLFLYVSFANVWICENFSGLTVSHSIPYIGNFCDTSNCDTSFNRIFGISSDPSTPSEIARSLLRMPQPTSRRSKTSRRTKWWNFSRGF